MEWHWVLLSISYRQYCTIKFECLLISTCFTFYILHLYAHITVKGVYSQKHKYHIYGLIESLFEKKFWPGFFLPWKRTLVPHPSLARHHPLKRHPIINEKGGALALWHQMQLVNLDCSVIPEPDSGLRTWHKLTHWLFTMTLNGPNIEEAKKSNRLINLTKIP